MGMVRILVPTGDTDARLSVAIADRLPVAITLSSCPSHPNPLRGPLGVDKINRFGEIFKAV